MARLRMLRHLKEIREMYLLTLVTKQQTRFHLKMVALARLMLDAYDFSLMEGQEIQDFESGRKTTALGRS